MSAREGKTHKLYPFYDPRRWRHEVLKYFMGKVVLRLASQFVNVDVDFRLLLESPKWYGYEDGPQQHFLDEAIVKTLRKAFNCMISLDASLLDAIYRHGQAPLICAIVNWEPYFVAKLIQKGADILTVDLCNLNTTLHYALKRRWTALATYLIENGVDVDAQNDEEETALSFLSGVEQRDADELICFLLYSGADPRLRNGFNYNFFENICLYKDDNSLLDTVFYYTYDEYTKFEINCSALCKLAARESPLADYFEDVLVEEDFPYYQRKMFELDLRYLRLWLKKFPSKLKIFLGNCTLHTWGEENGVTLEKIELFIHSDLKNEMIDCIQNASGECVLRSCYDAGMKEEEAAGIFCYLLSYGLELKLTDIQLIYDLFEYSFLFKICLHMDIVIVVDCEYYTITLPGFLYDVNLDLESCVQDHGKYSWQHADELLHYFVNPKLNELCLEYFGEEILPRINNMPQVPLLVELARNVFRKYFIRSFKIENHKQFYSLLNNLNISNTHKKIITYETKLY